MGYDDTWERMKINQKNPASALCVEALICWITQTQNIIIIERWWKAMAQLGAEIANLKYAVAT